MENINLIIASDHRGFELKSQILKYFKKTNINIKDAGTFTSERSDFTSFSFPTAESVANNKYKYGILICANGVGMSISANKVKGIRCVLAKTKEDVYQSRQHNDVNVLAIGADNTSLEEAVEMIKTLLSTKFLEGRYEKRVRQIKDYENN